MYWTRDANALWVKKVKDTQPPNLSWVDYCFNMPLYFWRHFTKLNDYESILSYIIHVNGYLKGVDSTVLGVWTTCLCGVTPEKSLSCRGVFSPPLRGVSTLVSAIRFWASCEGERTERWDSGYKQPVWEVRELAQTCRILSCDAGVLGVRRAMELLVRLYSDRRALEAEFVIPDSSAVWRAISLAWPSLTTSSSSASEIWNEKSDYSK